jgi:hypothetical protein
MLGQDLQEEQDGVDGRKMESGFRWADADFSESWLD